MGSGKRFSARLEPGDDASPIILAMLAAVEQFAQAVALDQRSAARLAVVAEELVANVIDHGNAGSPLSLELSLTARDDGVALALDDDGVPFDPTAPREFKGPDSDSGGGVGLAILRAWSRELEYAREGGRNRLRLVLPGSDGVQREPSRRRQKPG